MAMIIIIFEFSDISATIGPFHYSSAIQFPFLPFTFKSASGWKRKDSIAMPLIVFELTFVMFAIWIFDFTKPIFHEGWI
jgi:hypothetical protein